MSGKRFVKRTEIDVEVVSPEVVVGKLVVGNLVCQSCFAASFPEKEKRKRQMSTNSVVEDWRAVCSKKLGWTKSPGRFLIDTVFGLVALFGLEQVSSRTAVVLHAAALLVEETLPDEPGFEGTDLSIDDAVFVYAFVVANVVPRQKREQQQVAKDFLDQALAAFTAREKSRTPTRGQQNSPKERVADQPVLLASLPGFVAEAGVRDERRSTRAAAKEARALIEDFVAAEKNGTIPEEVPVHKKPAARRTQGPETTAQTDAEALTHELLEQNALLREMLAQRSRDEKSSSSSSKKSSKDRSTSSSSSSSTKSTTTSRKSQLGATEPFASAKSVWKPKRWPVEVAKGGSDDHLRRALRRETRVEELARETFPRETAEAVIETLVVWNRAPSDESVAKRLLHVLFRQLLFAEGRSSDAIRAAARRLQDDKLPRELRRAKREAEKESKKKKPVAALPVAKARAAQGGPKVHAQKPGGKRKGGRIAPEVWATLSAEQRSAITKANRE